MERSAKFKVALTLLLLEVIISSCATSSVVKQTQIQKPIDISANQKTRPLQFKKVVVKLSRGHKIGAIQGGLLCIPQAELTWLGGKATITGDEFTEVFREELEKANYTVVGDPNALFEDPSEWKAELLIAGLVTELQANICYPWLGFGNATTGKGEAYMKVNWQIYSRLDRKVIHERTTEGSSKVNDSSPTGPTEIFLSAFAVATQNLLADEGFHEMVVGSNKKIIQPSFEILEFARVNQSITPLNEHINDVRAAVVTIIAGDGHGSGVFITSEGHVLTSSHVVGGAKFVKVKLATGRELLGEVVRNQTRRDVALIKTEESQMIPLPIRDSEINVGEEVYAIGSPLDEKLNTTLSRGIVSGYRIEDGIRFIQSDVNVLPGSSGGPLVDSKGNVVGITVSGIFLSTAPSGLNFFAPINEALAPLNIKRAAQ